MDESQLTAEEVIAEIRDIAECMSVRGFRPGHISKSLKYRVRNFTLKTGMPLFGLWADHRKYKTEPGIVVISGRPVQITEPGIVILNGRPFQLHVTKTDDTHVDDTIAEICQELGECLGLVDWKELVSCEITPEYHDWTPEFAEAAICRAVERIPVLCDQLELASGLRTVEQLSMRSKPLRFSTWYDLFVKARYSENTSERAFRDWLKEQLGKTAFRKSKNGPISFDLEFLEQHGVTVPE